MKRQKIKKGGKRMILALNTALFLTVRLAAVVTNSNGAELVVGKEVKPGGTMNYAVPGCFNQAEASFDHWLTDELPEEDGITYVRYHNLGYSIEQTAKDVVMDAQRKGYDRVRVIGISIGDYVGRYAEVMLPNVETYAVNPEPDASLLRPGARAAAIAGSLFLKALSVPFGMLSVVPFPVLPDGDKITLSAFGDQLWSIAFAKAPKVYERTRGVIVCKGDQDEFLQSREIVKYFDGVPYAEVDSNHGNVVDKAEAYKKAWAELQ